MGALSGAVAFSSDAIVRRGGCADTVAHIADHLAVFIKGKEPAAVAAVDFDRVNILTTALGNVHARDAAVGRFAINGIFHAGRQVFVTDGARLPISREL